MPLASILVGPAPTRAELVSIAALHVDTIVWPPTLDDLTAELQPFEGGRRSALVLFELGEPHWSAFDAIRALRATRGLKLVTWSERAPHDAWTQVMPTQIECRLTPKELLTWVQVALGGVLGVTATELLDRVGWTVEAAAPAIDRLLASTEHASLGDVRQLIEPDPELHFVAALTRCDLRRARELLPRVTRLDDVVTELERRLSQMWTLGEVRPVSRLAHPRDIAGSINLEPDVIRELAPLVRLYSRQKIALRYEALAMVDKELRRGAPPAGLLAVLVATW